MFDAARDPHADVIVFPWWSRVLRLRRAATVARARGKGVIYWGHGLGKTLPLVGLALSRRSMRAADALLFYGPRGRDRFVAEIGVRTLPALHVAPNAVDQGPIRAATERWRNDPDALAQFRREHGLEGVPYVVYISRLEPEKRPQLLLEAVAAIPGLHVVFIGDGPERVALDAHAKRLGCADRAHLPGAVYAEDALAAWSLGACCAVQPDALGLSIFTAFGLGLPLVTCADSPEHGPEIEMFTPGENGLAFRRGDVVSLTEALRQMLNDQNLQRRCAAAALAAVGPGGRDLAGMVRGFAACIRDAYRLAQARRHS